MRSQFVLNRLLSTSLLLPAGDTFRSILTDEDSLDRCRQVSWFYRERTEFDEFAFDDGDEMEILRRALAVLKGAN